jgi:hypothetical protein
MAEFRDLIFEKADSFFLLVHSAGENEDDATVLYSAADDKTLNFLGAMVDRCVHLLGEERTRVVVELALNGGASESVTCRSEQVLRPKTEPPLTMPPRR